jgi:hypothetical protein
MSYIFFQFIFISTRLLVAMGFSLFACPFLSLKKQQSIPQYKPTGNSNFSKKAPHTYSY